MTLTCSWEGRAVSANRRLARGRHRFYRSPEYTAFLDSLTWLLRAAAAAAAWTRTAHDISVALDVELPRRMDTDAVVKPCIDAIQLAGLIYDDNQVKDHRARRVPGCGVPSRITYTITTIGNVT